MQKSMIELAVDVVTASASTMKHEVSTDVLIAQVRTAYICLRAMQAEQEPQPEPEETKPYRYYCNRCETHHPAHYAHETGAPIMMQNPSDVFHPPGT